MTLPYVHFLQPCSISEQAQPQFYSGPQRIYDFPLASTGSTDSGYVGEDTNPFDKGIRCPDVCRTDYSTSSMAQDQSAFASMAFTSDYSLMDPRQNSGSSNFAPYQQLGLTGTFQPPFRTLGHEQPQQLDAALFEVPREDSVSVKSEEEDSDGSQSPHDFHVSKNPQEQRKPLREQRRFNTKTQMVTNSAQDTAQAHERSTAKQGSSRGRTRKRIPHTAVERRYRENLNMHLEMLREAVPNLQTAQRRKSNDHPDALRPSKCEVLIGAVSYIKRLEDENEGLKKRRQQSNVAR